MRTEGMDSERLHLKIGTRIRSRKEQKRFFKFAVVGAIGAVVDLLVLNTLVFVFGVPELVANPFSVATAIVSNFTWNRLWSFPESRALPLLPQFGKYALINLMGLALNHTIFWLMLHYVLPSVGVEGQFIALNLAKAVAIGIVLFWNFGVNRVWTYRGL